MDVNYHEAKAFCTWKGPDYRLPTEAEHHRMRGNEVGMFFFPACPYPLLFAGSLSQPPTDNPHCDPVYDVERLANIGLKFGSSSVSSDTRMAPEWDLEWSGFMHLLSSICSLSICILPTLWVSMTSVATCGNGVRTTSMVCLDSRPTTSMMTTQRRTLMDATP